MRYVRFLAVVGLLLACLCGQSFSADVTGRAYVGAGAGTLVFIGDDHMTGSAFGGGRQTRLYGDLLVGYIVKPNLSVTASGGFGWQAYTFDDMRVCTVKPITIGVEYRHQIRKFVPRGGVGVGYYLWTVLQDRKVLKDPVTREELARGNVGGYVVVGTDYFMRPTIALCCDAIGHYILSEDKDDFPSAYALNDQVLILKVGVKYYFSPQKLHKP
ncbi:MAG: hypothetical protein V2A71_01045 [Candidatus Eisenbacteria bacterium]